MSNNTDEKIGKRIKHIPELIVGIFFIIEGLLAVYLQWAMAGWIFGIGSGIVLGVMNLNYGKYGHFFFGKLDERERKIRSKAWNHALLALLGVQFQLVVWEQVTKSTFSGTGIFLIGIFGFMIIFILSFFIQAIITS